MSFLFCTRDKSCALPLFQACPVLAPFINTRIHHNSWRVHRAEHIKNGLIFFMECRSYGQATRRKKQNMIVNFTSIVPCMARMADTALLTKENVLPGSKVVMYFVVVQSNLYLPFIGRDDKFFHHQVECILQQLPEARLVGFSFVVFVHVAQDGVELVRMKKICRI